jgi:hypothetical protein
MPSEPASGGSSTVPLTPERKKFLAEMERRNRAAREAGKQEAAQNPDRGRAKGGKVMKKSDKAGRALVKKSADTMGRAMMKAKGGKCYAKGGSVSSRADGVAKKGKTHTKMVAMKRGGMC